MMGRRHATASKGSRVTLRRVSVFRAQAKTGGKAKFLRRRDLDRKIEPLGRVEPARQHIVRVAPPSDLAALDRGPLCSFEGQDVGHHLAGMRALGEAVDHRHRGYGGELRKNRPRIEDADNDRIDETRQHARRVGDSLAACRAAFPCR